MWHGTVCGYRGIDGIPMITGEFIQDLQISSAVHASLQTCQVMFVTLLFIQELLHETDLPDSLTHGNLQLFACLSSFKPVDTASRMADFSC